MSILLFKMKKKKSCKLRKAELALKAGFVYICSTKSTPIIILFPVDANTYLLIVLMKLKNLMTLKQVLSFICHF